MKPDHVALLSFIAEAFESRTLPESVVPPKSSPTDIYQDAQAFAGKAWQQITCSELQEYYSAITGFSPEAFCYFLPGIFSSEIRENRPDLLINETLINSLNRGNAPNSWDDFFVERWPKLTPNECKATQQWLLWLSDSGCYEDLALSRSFDTLNLLLNQKSAFPLASWTRK
ncbi:MAG: DUF6714 family protein [Alphaproteobacteria bacterium]